MADFNTSNFGFNYSPPSFNFNSGPGTYSSAWDSFKSDGFSSPSKAATYFSSGSGDSGDKKEQTQGWLKNWIDTYGKSGGGFGDSRDRGYGSGSDRSISAIGGGGVQQQGDLTFVYPQTFSPFTIAGTPGSPSKWGKIGALAGGLLAAPFTGGMTLAAAAPIIGAGMSIGGTAGGVFDS